MWLASWAPRITKMVAWSYFFSLSALRRSSSKSLPQPDGSLPLVHDWELLMELMADGMWEELSAMLLDEFSSHIVELREMKTKAPSEWGTWPPWTVIVTIRDLALSVGFHRLARYSDSIWRLKNEITNDDLDEIITHLDTIFAPSFATATNVVVACRRSVGG